MDEEITWADVDCDHRNRQAITDYGYIVGWYCPECHRKWSDELDD